MENLTSIGGEFWIDNNDILTDLTPFENLTVVDSNIYIINNALLSNLFGFENIDPYSINNLTIYENPLLSDCDVQSICDYLIDPAGTIDIYNNAPGCNSQEEVELACLTSVVESGFHGQFFISPNPTESTTLITFILQQNSDVTIKILDLKGKEIAVLVNGYVQKGEHQLNFNIADLKPGIYFCALKTYRGLQTLKMIVIR